MCRTMMHMTLGLHISGWMHCDHKCQQEAVDDILNFVPLSEELCAIF